MEHERMRFATMNIRQLWTRLNRITDREKLRKFLVVSMEKVEEFELQNRMVMAGEYRRLHSECFRKLYGTPPDDGRDSMSKTANEELDRDDYLKRIGAK